MKPRDAKIAAFLEQLGIPRHWNGFVCAGKLIQAYMDGYDGKLTTLYRTVSEQCGCNAERVVRFARDKVMTDNPDFFRVLGLPETRWGTGFSDKEFIITAAARLKEQEKLEADDDRMVTWESLLEEEW